MVKKVVLSCMITTITLFAGEQGQEISSCKKAKKSALICSIATTVSTISLGSAYKDSCDLFIPIGRRLLIGSASGLIAIPAAYYTVRRVYKCMQYSSASE